MSKIRQAVIGTLTASVIVVGGLGAGNAWARSDGSGNHPHHAATSGWNRHRSDDCPHQNDGSDSASGTASLFL